ncbi:MAG TPA: folate-binding protein [Stellaceae bacterium]|nr:folate-binding protein [Stellaceae bacterium]
MLTLTGGRFAVLEDRGILAIGGPDRVSFLQGLVSNDVARVGPDRAIYAALLTAQGKYLHDFILVEHDETIWLDGEAARLADLMRRLTMFRLRAKVRLDGRPDLAVAAVFGAKPTGLPDEPGAARTFGEGSALVDPRLADLGLRVILPRTQIREVLSEAGASEVEFAEYDRYRLELGVPDGSRDLVLDKTILLEAGFDELHGVDWNKGCYIGQELTARTKYRGLIKKRLFPVKLDGAAPEPGAIVTLNGHEAGEMRSSRDDIGLALLRLEAVAIHEVLMAGDTIIQPLMPDWMRLPK